VGDLTFLPPGKSCMQTSNELAEKNKRGQEDSPGRRISEDSVGRGGGNQSGVRPVVRGRRFQHNHKKKKIKGLKKEDTK